LGDRLRTHHITFIIEPYVRFQGEVGEQATMFFFDPSGNALEFKAFGDDDAIFSTAEMPG
jgi:extradiol dioxygenase family protein